MSEGRERATASLAAGIFSTFSTVCDNYGVRTGRRGQAARRRGATGHSEWGHAAPGEELDTSVPGKPVQKLSVQIEGVKTTVVNTKNVQIIQIRQERGIEMYKVEVVHTCHGIALGRKKNEVWSSATEGMHLDGVVLSEVSQAEKDK